MRTARRCRCQGWASCFSTRPAAVAESRRTRQRTKGTSSSEVIAAPSDGGDGAGADGSLLLVAMAAAGDGKGGSNEGSIDAVMQPRNRRAAISLRFDRRRRAGCSMHAQQPGQEMPALLGLTYGMGSPHTVRAMASNGFNASAANPSWLAARDRPAWKCGRDGIWLVVNRSNRNKLQRK